MNPFTGHRLGLNNAKWFGSQINFENYLFLRIPILIIFLLNINVGTSFASAGYYPTYVGDKIQIESCIPDNIRNNLFLQIETSHNQWITLEEVKFGKLIKKGCRKNYQKLQYSWKVKTKLNGALRIWDKTNKGANIVWPDGVLVVEMKK